MKNNEKSFEHSVYIIAGLISALLLLAGIVLAYRWEADAATNLFYKLFPIFVSELGIAGLVALIIIFTIEKFSRQRHLDAADRLMEDINSDLFHAIFKRYIPDPVFNEVEKCLFCSEVLRKNYEVSYELAFINGDEIDDGYEQFDLDKYLWCNVGSNYRLKNLTDGDITIPIEMQLELPIDTKLHGLLKFTELWVNGEEVKDLKIEKTDSHLQFKHIASISAGAEIKIQVAAETIKQKLDMEVWASRLPSDGLRLRVSSPSSITVNATANHSQQLRKNSVGNKQHSITWELDSGIFPFQSVIFWWNVNEETK